MVKEPHHREPFLTGLMPQEPDLGFPLFSCLEGHIGTGQPHLQQYGDDYWASKRIDHLHKVSGLGNDRVGIQDQAGTQRPGAFYLLSPLTPVSPPLPPLFWGLALETSQSFNVFFFFLGGQVLG